MAIKPKCWGVSTQASRQIGLRFLRVPHCREEEPHGRKFPRNTDVSIVGLFAWVYFLPWPNWQSPNFPRNPFRRKARRGTHYGRFSWFVLDFVIYNFEINTLRNSTAQISNRLIYSKNSIPQLLTLYAYLDISDGLFIGMLS